MPLLTIPLLLLAAEAGASAPSAAAAELRPIASREPGWPQFRGPRRDGRSDETGLLDRWPEGGPPVLWAATGLGRGYSSPIIVGERIYITGEVGDALRIFALDLGGKPVWESSNGRAWKGPYPGARASCTYDGGRIYHRNAHGRVACLDASTGRELWALDVLDRFQGEGITWGIAECLVVDGDRVFVTAGGRKALVCALDKLSGDLLWASEPLRDRDGGEAAESASYASPLLCEFRGRRLLIGSALRHHFVADADSGRILHVEPLPTAHSVIAMLPVAVGDAYFLTAPDTDSGGLFRVLGDARGVRVERAWSTQLDTCHGGAVLVGDRIVGSWYRRAKGWACVAAASGKVLFESPDPAMGAVLWADGMLYCASQEGEIVLLEAGTSSFASRGRFRTAEGRTSDAWAHPVILDGRLYVRHHETLRCHDVRAR